MTILNVLELIVVLLCVMIAPSLIIMFILLWVTHNKNKQF